MLNRLGKCFTVIGVVLLTAALLLFLWNENEDRSAGQAARSAMDAVRQAEAARDTAYSFTLDQDETQPTLPTASPTAPEELTTMEIQGHTYIGYLLMPDYELELPVMANWSMEKLQLAPCLQYGSPLTDDAVIAGHNYKEHFRTLHDMKPGDSVIFTDMGGYTICYTVTNVKTIDPRSVYEVINSEHDLVLYTCTIGGQSRVIVECDRAD